MNYQTRLALVILALAASSSSVDAFTVTRTTNHVSPTTSSSTKLQLVPEQGKQLVAAFEAGCAEHHEHPGTAEETPIGTMDAAKSFVSRIFSIPGAIMGRHPAAEPALVELPASRKTDNDVVLYPIVGFQFVNGGQQVVPTKTNAACRINNLKDQEVFGWYTTSCRLNSIYSDTYCDEPKMIENTQQTEES